MQAHLIENKSLVGNKSYKCKFEPKRNVIVNTVATLKGIKIYKKGKV